MTTQTEALRLALEALQFALHVGFPESSESQIKKGEKAYQQHRAAITAIKEALAQPDQDEVDIRSRLYQRIHELETQLAQPEQEPVAWMLEGLGPDCGPYFEIYRDDEMGWRNKKEWTPLYTTPPQRTWVGLDPEEQSEMWDRAEKRQAYQGVPALAALIQEVEAKLKDKNL